MSRLFHHEHEPAAARAAARNGVFYALSTVGTASIEDIAEICSGPKMLQLYIFRDRQITVDFLERCNASGYDAICLTVDTPVPGNRERDRRTGMTMPPKFTPRSLLSLALHPGWTIKALQNGGFKLVNLDAEKYGIDTQRQTVTQFIHEQFDQSLNWRDVEWLRDQWQGKLVIKGLVTPEDAKLAVKAGVDAIMVSNHGGRQLEGAPAIIDQIEPIAQAVGGEAEIICDGGIRRGAHIVKAMALGASSCSVGKAYLYGLAAGGEAGVQRAFALLKDEIKTCLALLGETQIRNVNRSHIRHISQKFD